MSTHTPGPWEAVKSDRNQFAWDVIGAPGIVPTIARLGLVDPNEHTVKANAYLIAAAPAMLEALKQADNIIRNILTDSQLDQRTECGLTMRKYFSTVQAAIAKAEGRA